MTEKEIEAVARALCKADGHDPVFVQERLTHLWFIYCHEEKKHIAAHDALAAVREANNG